jgi:hypothetical protein
LLSLNDIQFAIFRNEKKDPFFYQETIKKKIFKNFIPFDNRVNFALHFGNVSSPILNSYSYIDLDNELEKATSNFIQNEVEIIKEESTVVLPSLFEIYFTDFGNSIDDILGFVQKYLSIKQINEFKSIPKNQLKIVYQKYDWSLNAKTLKEETEDVKIDFEKIKKDKIYRDYFYKFCQTEYSTENLDCYDELNNFDSIVDNDEKTQFGKLIFEKYVEFESPKQLNINSVTVELYRDIFNEGKILTEKFVKLRREIEFIMVDSYTRFRFSKYYDKMLEDYVLLDLKKFENKEAYQNYDQICSYIKNDDANDSKSNHKKSKKFSKIFKFSFFGNVESEQDETLGKKN